MNLSKAYNLIINEKINGNQILFLDDQIEVLPNFFESFQLLSGIMKKYYSLVINFLKRFKYWNYWE